LAKRTSSTCSGRAAALARVILRRGGPVRAPRPLDIGFRDPAR
jgi:hypothetical protein